MNEELPKQEKTEQEQLSPEQALMEIKMCRQNRRRMGNYDVEGDRFAEVISKLKEGTLTPEKAVQEAYIILNSAQVQ
jgi:hypothetical protein